MFCTKPQDKLPFVYAYSSGKQVGKGALLSKFLPVRVFGVHKCIRTTGLHSVLTDWTRAQRRQVYHFVDEVDGVPGAAVMTRPWKKLRIP